MKKTGRQSSKWFASTRKVSKYLQVLVRAVQEEAKGCYALAAARQVLKVQIADQGPQVPHVHARQGQRLGYRAKQGFVIYRTHLHEEVRPQTPCGQGPPLRQA